MKRDVQGKFALKDNEYRSVRSLRLTDSTWEALSTAANSLGITKADYLEQIVSKNEHLLSSNTWKDEDSPSITRLKKEIEQLQAEVRHLNQENTLLRERATVKCPQLAELEALHERVLFELKLGKQAPGYKAAQKALNRFIAELIHQAQAFQDFANSISNASLATANGGIDQRIGEDIRE